MVEFLELLFSSLIQALTMLPMYFLRLYSGEPLYETIRLIGSPACVYLVDHKIQVQASQEVLENNIIYYQSIRCPLEPLIV